MNLAGGLLAGAAVMTTLVVFRQEAQRGQAKWVAETLAEATGKPIINIGCKWDKWGDVRCDIQPQAGAIYCDAINTGFPDKTFSVAFLSHLLEHTDCPEAVLKEAQRIADNVVVVLPNPFDLPTWVVPGHKWIFVGANKMGVDSGLVASLLSVLGLGVTVGLVATKTRAKER